MIVKIKKYVAKVSIFKEHEDGSISKEVREITLDGKRFSPATVWKKIPREAKLEEMGWKVILVWECELKKKDFEGTMERVILQITSGKQPSV